MELSADELKLLRHALTSATRAISELSYYMTDRYDAEPQSYDALMAISSRVDALYKLRARVEVAIEQSKLIP